MNKKVLISIIEIVSFIILLLLIIGLVNKTYFKRHYEVNKGSIPIPLFSYYNGVKGKYNVTFNTLRSVKKVESILNKYVENLQSCYDESYFYDKGSDITISKYQVKNGFLFNKIYLSYTKGNYCDAQYVLDNKWIDTFKSKAKVSELVIDRCITTNNELKCDDKRINSYDALELINDASNSKRIDNKKNINFDQTKDYYSISVYYTIDKQGYTLSIFKYGNDIALKVVDANDHPKNAIYSYSKDLDQVFKDIYNKY